MKHELSNVGGVPGYRLGEQQIAVEIARCVFAIRRRDLPAAEHHAVQAQLRLVAMQRASHRHEEADG